MDEEIKPEIVQPKKESKWFKYLFIAFYILIIMGLFFVGNAVKEQQKAFTDDPCGFCDKHCKVINPSSGGYSIPNLSLPSNYSNLNFVTNWLHLFIKVKK